MERLLIALAIPLLLAFVPLKLTTPSLKQLARLLWLFGGLVLLVRGGTFLVQMAPEQDAFAAWLLSSPWAMAAGVVLALGIGFVKGKFILKKSCMRNLARLEQLEHPVKPIHVYDVRSWIVIAIMIGLAQVFGLIGLAYSVRGIILLGIGAGLVVSSSFYTASGSASKQGACCGNHVASATPQETEPAPATTGS